VNRAALEALRRQVRPVAMTGALTLAQAAAALRLNCEVAQYHAALNQAERIFELAGLLDERLARELTSRGARLVRAAETLLRGARDGAATGASA
jgi:hypothetical protein